jgi:hypothetical protein
MDPTRFSAEKFTSAICSIQNIDISLELTITLRICGNKDLLSKDFNTKAFKVFVEFLKIFTFSV